MFDRFKAIVPLLVLAGYVLVFLGGAHVGAARERSAQQLTQLKAVHGALVDYTAAVKQGNAAAADLINERNQHAANYRALAEKFGAISGQLPIIARDAARSTPGVTATVASTGGGTVTQLIAVPVADDQLSLGAVWMWNSALAGGDVATGACGVDGSTGQATAACAEGAGLTVDDAWENHAANAEICALDRLRYQRLIDFLKARGGK